MSEKTRAEVSIDEMEKMSPEQLQRIKEVLEDVANDVIPWIARVKLLEAVVMFLGTRQEHLAMRLRRLEEAYNMTEEDLLSGKKPEVGPTPQEQMSEIIGLTTMSKMLQELKDTKPVEKEEEQS